MAKRALVSLVLVTVALGIARPAGTSGEASVPRITAGGSASAVAIQLVVPGHQPVVFAPAGAPSPGSVSGSRLRFPRDGSIVSVGSFNAAAAPGVRAGQGSTVSAAAVRLDAVSLFSGALGATSIDLGISATARTAGGAAADPVHRISGLTVGGRPVPAVPGSHFRLGDWATAVVLGRAASTDPGGRGARVVGTAVDIRLTSPHAGLPAGTELLVGAVDAASSVGARRSAADLPDGLLGIAPGPAPSVTGLEPPELLVAPGESRHITHPLRVTPSLGSGGRVFPVYGVLFFADTFGAPRSDVSFHHGVDIFARVGTPVLAVASGVVFSVGPNPVGGNRLWLRDRRGNEYYYAHLEAYSPLAVDGARVEAGDVLGYVGNTGDAEGTPYHLHFEVHPAGLLKLGYDGAVDPTVYLRGWRHMQLLRLPPLGRWLPANGAAAAEPGAYILATTDISSVSGLDPPALEHVVTNPAVSRRPSRG